MLEIDVLPASSDEKGADSILVRLEPGDESSQFSASQRIILIDGGHKDKTESIIRHVRSVYNASRIDCVICTHPDADHINGITALIESRELHIENLCVHDPWKNAYGRMRKGRTGGLSILGSLLEPLEGSLDALDDLLHAAAVARIHVHSPFAGTTIYDAITVLGPTQNYYTHLVTQFPGMPHERSASYGEEMIECRYNANDQHFVDNPITSARNDSSVVSLLNFDGFRVLFTGDCGVEGIGQALKFAADSGIDYIGVNYLQIPHHGSIKNLSAPLLNAIAPKQAFVSAPGKSDKHPSRLVMNYLRHHRQTNVYHLPDSTLRLSYRAPPRPGWTAVDPAPLHSTVFRMR